jgi:hypothetical protein
MNVMEVGQALRRLGWDTEVVVSINGVEHQVLEVKEAVLPHNRAVLVVHPEPDPRTSRPGTLP